MRGGRDASLKINEAGWLEEKEEMRCYVFASKILYSARSSTDLESIAAWILIVGNVVGLVNVSRIHAAQSFQAKD